MHLPPIEIKLITRSTKVKVKLALLLITISVTISSKDIKLATDVWEPFRIKENSSLTGIDIEIIQLLEKELVSKILVIQKPWARCLKSMESGTVDMMIGLAYTEDRAKYIEYIDIAYYRVKPAFFQLKSKAKIENYRDLSDKKIGYVNGSSYFKEFDNDLTLEKVALPQEKMLITMLLRNSIDIFIGSDIQVKYELNKKKLSDKIVETDYSPNHQIDLYLGISKKSDLMDKKEIIEKAIKKIISDGKVDEIVQGYIN